MKRSKDYDLARDRGSPGSSTTAAASFSRSPSPSARSRSTCAESAMKRHRFPTPSTTKVSTVLAAIRGFVFAATGLPAWLAAPRLRCHQRKQGTTRQRRSCERLARSTPRPSNVWATICERRRRLARRSDRAWRRRRCVTSITRRWRNAPSCCAPRRADAIGIARSRSPPAARPIGCVSCPPPARRPPGRRATSPLPNAETGHRSASGGAFGTPALVELVVGIHKPADPEKVSSRTSESPRRSRPSSISSGPRQLEATSRRGALAP